MELQEAAQINIGLQPASIGRESSLHDMKAIVKTWRSDTVTQIRESNFDLIFCASFIVTKA